jgi:tRNA G18 (ribose-2'-O)-methylase SpoU
VPKNIKKGLPLVLSRGIGKAVQSMRTRCVYPECAQEYEVAAELVPADGRPASSTCPHCRKQQSSKPMDVLQFLGRQAERHPFNLELVRSRFVILVEDVRSLHNVGSIFRTADGAGVGAIILCGISGVPPRKQIAKASLGAEEQLPWTYCTNAMDILPILKSHGYTIAALEKNGQSIELTPEVVRQRLRAPLCLIVGNEVSGVSPQTLSGSDLICHLPMKGIKESLNVSVAFGIAAYMIAADLI